MRKGFTLVEILAVLTILAIVSFIAVPLAINIINDTKEKALDRSVENYISAVEAAIASHNSKLDNEDVADGSCVIEEKGNLDCDGIKIKVNVKNKYPTSGTIVIKNYEVVSYIDLAMGNKKYNRVIFNGTYVAPTPWDTHKGIIYLDPTDYSNDCNEYLAAANLNENGTPTGIKTGCMAFYIYDDTGDNYKLLLDHNTTPIVEWNSEGTNLMMLEAQEALENDTKNWIGEARLITADEVAHIVGADREDALKWNSTKPIRDDYYNGVDTSINVSGFSLGGSGADYNGWWYVYSANYDWMFNYTSYCGYSGCTIEDSNTYGPNDYYSYGYWTSTPTLGTSWAAWTVDNYGSLYWSSTDWGDYGVRPVLILPKYVLNSSDDNTQDGQIIYNGIKVPATEEDTHKGIVYLDPTNLANECSASNSNSIPGTHSGCMKFYIYDDAGNNYKMILNHNIYLEESIFNKMGLLSYSDINLKNKKSLLGSYILSLDNNLLAITTGGTANSNSYAAKLEKWSGDPRLITVDEIAHIVGIDTALDWSSSKPYYSNFYYYEKYTPLENISPDIYSVFFSLGGSGNTLSGWTPYGDENYEWVNLEELEEAALNYQWLFEGLTDNEYYCTSTSAVGFWNNRFKWTIIYNGIVYPYDTEYWCYIEAGDSKLMITRPTITLSKTLIDSKIASNNNDTAER